MAENNDFLAPPKDVVLDEHSLNNPKSIMAALRKYKVPPIEAYWTAVLDDELAPHLTLKVEVSESHGWMRMTMIDRRTGKIIEG